MSDENIVETTTRAAAEIMKAVPIYQDALQPVAQEIGKSLKTIGGVINLALAPLEAVIYGFDKIRTKLSTDLEKRLSDVPPENIVSPKLELVGPLLEKYKYCYENEAIAKMFINLLANAMDKNQVINAHPSFVNIIAELSPDEARLIEVMSQEKLLPKIDIISELDPAKNDGKSGYISVYTNFTLFEDKAKLQYPELSQTYFSNLERLNIVSAAVGNFSPSYADESLYEPLKNSERIMKLKESFYDEKRILKDKPGIIDITAFGKIFMNAVLNKD